MKLFLTLVCTALIVQHASGVGETSRRRLPGRMGRTRTRGFSTVNGRFFQWKQPNDTQTPATKRMNRRRSKSVHHFRNPLPKDRQFLKPMTNTAPNNTKNETVQLREPSNRKGWSPKVIRTEIRKQQELLNSQRAMGQELLRFIEILTGFVTAAQEEKDSLSPTLKAKLDEVTKMMKQKEQLLQKVKTERDAVTDKLNSKKKELDISEQKREKLRKELVQKQIELQQAMDRESAAQKELEQQLQTMNFANGAEKQQAAGKIQKLKAAIRFAKQQSWAAKQQVGRAQNALARVQGKAQNDVATVKREADRKIHALNIDVRHARQDTLNFKHQTVKARYNLTRAQRKSKHDIQAANKSGLEKGMKIGVHSGIQQAAKHILSIKEQEIQKSVWRNGNSIKGRIKQDKLKMESRIKTLKPQYEVAATTQAADHKGSVAANKK